jgi:hypothetical protein
MTAKERILRALREGVNVEKELMDIEDDEVEVKESLTQEQWDNLLEETKEEFQSEEGSQNRANFNIAYKKNIQDAINYNGKSLKQEDFTNPALDIEDITPKKSIYNTENRYKKWLDGIDLFKNGYDEILTDNDKENLEAILDRVNQIVLGKASIPQAQDAELIPEQLVSGILNFELQEDREKIYTYWRKIAKRYNPMVKSVKAFKGASKDSNLDEELKEKIDNLIVPPPYIGLVPATKQDMGDLTYRLGTWVAFVGRAYAEAERLDSSNYFQRGEPRDLKDMKLRDRANRGNVIPTWRKEEGAEHGPREQLHDLDETEFDEQKKDFEYVDPYYAYQLENQLNFPIRTLEVNRAKRILNKWLEMTKARGGMEHIEKVLHRKILEIQLQAHKSTGDRKYYLPYTDWIESKYDPTELGEKMPESGKHSIDNLFRGFKTIEAMTDATSKFFDDLADILFEMKGQEQVDSPEGHHKMTGVQIGRNIVDPNLATYQEGVEPVPREFTDNNLKDKLEKMLKLLDSYYFTPIIGKADLFIGSIPPKFTSAVEGSRSFNLLGIEFSNHPIIQQIRDIHATLEDNVNMESLKKIRDYLKEEASSEKQHNTELYIKKLQELANKLDDWFEDEQWALEYVAFQLNLYLKGKGSTHDLSRLTINDKNAQKLYDAFIKRGGQTHSVVHSLRSFLLHPRFQKLIAEQERMGINVTQYNTVTNEILRLTEPERVNEVPEFAKALLETHDVVREMNGKEIIHATLSLYDVDAMDYIITKMENKHKVDITAMDVMTIVKSCDSFQSLSNNHGLSQDVIYEIKGLCR